MKKYTLKLFSIIYATTRQLIYCFQHSSVRGTVHQAMPQSQINRASFDCQYTHYDIDNILTFKYLYRTIYNPLPIEQSILNELQNRTSNVIKTMLCSCSVGCLVEGASQEGARQPRCDIRRSVRYHVYFTMSMRRSRLFSAGTNRSTCDDQFKSQSCV